MKKILIFSLLIININLCYPIYASNSEVLSKIENNFYGFDYSKDSLKNRVNRLEKAIYGKSSSGDINKRITKLSGDISADVIGLEIEPVKDTFLAEEQAIEDSSVNYPILDDIEKKLFNKTNSKLDIHSRIVKIEKKIFNKIYDIDDYSKRIYRIKEKIMPERIVQQEFQEQYDGSYYNDDMINSMDLSGTKQSWFKMPFGQKKYTRPYSNYGEFSGINDATALNRDNLSDDLTQMEYDMFGTEFSNEDTHSRIKRLNSVNKAKKSSKKYDSQKFQQHMSTAMEIGAMILMILAMVL